jgi:hypothetical protein
MRHAGTANIDQIVLQPDAHAVSLFFCLVRQYGAWAARFNGVPFFNYLSDLDTDPTAVIRAAPVRSLSLNSLLALLSIFHFLFHSLSVRSLILGQLFVRPIVMKFSVIAALASCLPSLAGAVSSTDEYRDAVCCSQELFLMEVQTHPVLGYRTIGLLAQP